MALLAGRSGAASGALGAAAAAAAEGAWRVRVGLEVHAQIQARSKLFSRARGTPGGDGEAGGGDGVETPNTAVALVDAALPGTLPVLNTEAVDAAIRTALALKGQVCDVCEFERKHYFYADLPHGYQITQARRPIATAGRLSFALPKRPKNQKLRKGWSDDAYEVGAMRTVRLTRVQIEQDTGKSLHDGHPHFSLLDYNRAGTGLLELVFEPDIVSPLDAGVAVQNLQLLLRTIGVCDGNLEDGSMRVDVNVSVTPASAVNADDQGETDAAGGGALKAARVEVKNLNSVRAVVEATQVEAERQVAEYERGGTVVAETRLYDSAPAGGGETKRMRSKESVMDYRYFFDPDLPPLVIDPERVHQLRENLPELPEETIARLGGPDCGLDMQTCATLLGEPGAVAFFDAVMKQLAVDAKTAPSATDHVELSRDAANWLCNNVFGNLRDAHMTLHETAAAGTFRPVDLADVMRCVADGTISSSVAKSLLGELVRSDGSFSSTASAKSGSRVRTIILERDLFQLSDPEELRQRVQQFLSNERSKVVKSLRSGKMQGPAAIKGVMGPVMGSTKGRANPQVLREVVEHCVNEFLAAHRQGIDDDR